MRSFIPEITYQKYLGKEPRGKNKIVTAELYKSWADVNYSPVGLLTFHFGKEDVFSNKKIEILREQLDDFRLVITCELNENRFTDWVVVAEPFEKLSMGIERLAFLMWFSALNQFDYDIANIMPFDTSKETVEDYKKNRETNQKGFGSVEKKGYTKQITQVLLALEYLQYLNYQPSNNYASAIMAEPEKFKTVKAYMKKTDKEIAQRRLTTFSTRLSRVSKELYTKTQGRQGGALTTQSVSCLGDFLEWTEYKGTTFPRTLSFDYEPNVKELLFPKRAIPGTEANTLNVLYKHHV